MELIYFKPGTELCIDRGVLEEGHTFKEFLFEGEIFCATVTDNYYCIDERHEDFYVVIVRVLKGDSPLYLATRQHKNGQYEDWRCYEKLVIALGNEDTPLPSLSGHRKLRIYGTLPEEFDTEKVNVDLRGMNRPKDFSLVDFSQCYATYWSTDVTFGRCHTLKRLRFWHYDADTDTMSPYQPIDEKILPHISEIHYAYADMDEVKFDTDSVLQLLDKTRGDLRDAFRKLVPSKGVLEIPLYTIHRPCPSITSFSVTKMRFDNNNRLEVFDNNNGRWYDFNLIVGIEGLCYFYNFVYKTVKGE